MQAPTAPAKIAEIRFVQTGTSSLHPLYLPALTQEAIAIQPLNIATTYIAEPSDSRTEVSMGAEWLNVVEQRIKASIAVEGYALKGNTAWLRPDVGGAALDFFRKTSSALPGEPYIYSSRQGDLVAEFSAPDGKMTCLISPEFVIVFAVSGDNIIEKKFLPKEQGIDTLRSDIQKMSNLLAASLNGTVETRP